MNTEYRYKLDNSSKKFICPECNKKRFVRFIDAEKDEYLPEEFGRCDRENKCGYHLDPYKSGYSKMIWEQEQGFETKVEVKKPIFRAKPQQQKEITFIPINELKNTLRDYEKNIFIQNLLHKIAFPFKAKEIERIIELYRLGTYAKNGAVCFPFIDLNQNVRAVQEKIFDATNHTDKTKKYHTSWLHSRLKYSQYKNKPLPNWLQAYLNNDTKVSCLFGEHLLTKYPQNPVALVEAPKTAIYGTLYFGFPEQATNFIWLSTFNLSSFSFEKCKVLKGRDVYLFPDASENGTAFKDWSSRATEIESKLSGTNFIVSDLLEKYATDVDKKQGNDLADYLIKQDWRKYRPQPEPEEIEIPTSEKSENNEAKNKPFFSENEVEVLGSNKNKKNNDDKIRNRIRECRNRIRQYEIQVCELTNEIKALEKKLKQNAECCKVEWFRPKWYGKQYQNKLNEIQYWTS